MATSTAALTAFEPRGATEEAEVVRVIDGDSIAVSLGGEEREVRYVGLEAPEGSSGDPAADALAEAATDANAALVERATVHLERDLSDTDMDGRLLRHVWIRDGGDWTHVGLELVRQGMAQAKVYPPGPAWQAELEVAEEEARAAGRGRWALTPTP